MQISDPAQLLQRVPELQALIDDQRIRRAIESGDPFKVYRALVLARLFRRLPQHAGLLKSLTGERRLFAKSLKGTPALGNINSLGFGFVGNAEEDTDGSHIALHAIVVLWVMPIIPLGAYVVKSTGEREWQIYARAPLGILGWLYTRGLALALVLLVGTGAVQSFHASTYQDLVVLNGFDVPLTIRFGAQLVELPAQGRVTIAVPTGKASGTATAKQGGVIDTFDQDVVSSGRLSIWNVAGAAPLVRNTVVYVKAPQNSKDDPGSQEVYCGKRYVELDNIEYRFTEPPQSKSMSKHQTSTSVEQATVITMPKRPGVDLCMRYTADQGNHQGIARIMEATAQLEQWKPELSGPAFIAARAVSLQETVRVIRRALAARPGEVDFERALQDARDDLGEHAMQMREFDERAKLHPDSPMEQYLRASLLSGRNGVEAMQAVVQRFPDYARALRSLAWRKAAHHDYAGSYRDIQVLHKLSEPEAQNLLDVELRMLMAQQRGAEAIKLLDGLIRDKDNANRLDLATEFALIARTLRADPERHLRTHPSDPENLLELDLFRVRGGLDPLQGDSAEAPQIKLALALRGTPERAIEIANTFNVLQFFGMSSDQKALLFSEASRQKNAQLAKKMQASLQLSTLEDTLLQRFVRGEDVTLDQNDFDLDLQAAAFFVRSRNAHLPAAERAALRARAAQADLLRGAVSTALKQWGA